METNSTPFTTTSLGKNQSAKRFFDNLKTNKKVHTHIIFLTFLICGISSCLVFYKFGRA
jgi:hypothetical protein